VERAAARLAEAEEAARSAAEEARLRTAEFEEAEADMTRLGDEARSLRERLKVVDSQFEQARKRREATAAQKQLAARAAEKGQRAEVLARERVLRLRNTPD
jgi:chromosome segregation ATPase